MSSRHTDLLSRHQEKIFFGIWILLGLFQARLTELQDDEAYYWVFSKYPDWGYFDHPPLIAILVKAGYAIFPNEFGVRFFPFILHILTLFILRILLRDQPRMVFQFVLLSIAVLQLTGFFAVPDTPLIFATAVFFLCYKRFLEKNHPVTTVLLGFSAALLLYSKYHGGLVVLFTLLSHLRLLVNYRIYIAGLVALLLFTPHLIWQMDHNWVSFRYHLLESNVNPYKISHTLDYVLGQLLAAGPVAGFILIPAAFLFRARDKMDRALKFTLTGIYVFFLLSSFRGKVEMNWTAPVLVPLVILSCKFIATREKWLQALRFTLPVSILVVLMARIITVADLVPNDSIRKKYHAWKEWPAKMNERTGNSPVVFSNSYQRASKYWFYSGTISYSQNLYKEHRNQYNYWPVEDSLIGTHIYHLDIYDISRMEDSLQTPLGTVGFRSDPRFISLAKLNFSPTENRYEVPANEPLSITAEIEIPRRHREVLKENSHLPLNLKLAIFSGNRWISDLEMTTTGAALLLPRIVFTAMPHLKQGNYHLMFALEVPGYYPTHNSERFPLKIE